ncbi:hypothetical protein C0J52_13546 [Blattella germanica]|nr:hypothetical protein C0J52_13546 [Blattella germanica]
MEIGARWNQFLFQLRSEEVVRAYISRLQEINPILNAIVEDRYAEAIKDAQQIDKEIASKRFTEEELESNRPLLGVPITVKESCTVKGCLSTSVGSLPRHGIKADKDGAAVNFLRKAGAIPLLVSNTPEYCLSWETNNLVTGKTVNPYNPLRTSGGSSGGEAALVGAGASVVGVGSDVAGSIRIPAMFNGVYGHKPTPGYISIEGHFPTVQDVKFENYLTVGPIARYSEDLRLLLSIMAGERAVRLKLNEKVDLQNLNIYYMADAGFSLVLLPVEDEIKKTILFVAKHLNTKYGSRLKGVLEQLNLLSEFLKSIFGMSYFSFSLIVFYCLQTTNALIPKGKYSYYYKRHEELRNKFTVVAAPHQDRLCLAVAEALEKDLGGWIPPSTNNTNVNECKNIK